MDQFEAFSTALDSPAMSAMVIVAGNDIPTTRAIYIGGDGDLVVEMKGGQEVTFKNVVAGMVYPFRITGVKVAGTTATNIIALY